MEGQWLSITDYSEYRNISISTIRRYIKANRVKYKKEHGKYFIYVSDENYQIRQQKREKDEFSTKMEIVELRTRIRELEEENNDLRMLVSIYESRTDTTQSVRIDLPSLPPEVPGEL